MRHEEFRNALTTVLARERCVAANRRWNSARIHCLPSSTGGIVNSVTCAMSYRALWILCLVVGEAVAGATDPVLTINPSSPLAGQPVVATVAVTGCTLLPPAATVLRNGASVRVELEVPDFCSPSEVIPQRTYSIGAFDQGQYVVEVHYCGNPPPPLPRCALVRSQAMDVRGTQYGVPALGGTSARLMVLAALLLGVVCVWRRH